MSDEGETVTEWEGVDVLGNLIDNQRCDMTQGRGGGERGNCRFVYNDSGRGRGNKKKTGLAGGGGRGGVARIDQYYMWGECPVRKEKCGIGRTKPLTHREPNTNSLLLDFTSSMQNKCLRNGAWNAAIRKKEGNPWDQIPHASDKAGRRQSDQTPGLWLAL